MKRRLFHTLILIAVASQMIFILPAWSDEIQKQSLVPQDSMRTSIKLNGGMFSAVGLGGVSIGYSLLNSLELEGALGYGYSGLQLSLMPRLLLGSHAHRFATGVGLAVGIPLSPEHLPVLADSPTLWTNLDLLGYEYRGASGLVLSISAGIAVGLAGNYEEICLLGCEHDPQMQSILGLVVPQARIGIGFRF